MDEGGGMYAHERTYHAAKGLWQRMFAPAQAAPAAEAGAAEEVADPSKQDSFAAAVMLPGDAQRQEPEGKVASEAAGSARPPAPWGPGS